MQQEYIITCTAQNSQAGGPWKSENCAHTYFAPSVITHFMFSLKFMPPPYFHQLTPTINNDLNCIDTGQT